MIINNFFVDGTGINKSRVTCWWMESGNERLLNFNSFGVYRVMRRVGEGDQVIFVYIPCTDSVVDDFASNPRGGVDVRYTEHGRLDNPRLGRAFLYIAEIKPRVSWINKMVMPEYSYEPVVSYLQASCVLLNKRV